MQRLGAALLLGLAAANVFGATNTLTINLQSPGITVSPLLYGIFFEEINRAGDGGIYAEMLRNRSFEEDANYPMAWTATKATNTLDRTVELNTNNPTSMKVVASAGGKVSNCGFVAGGPGWDPAGMQTYYASQPGQIAVEAGKVYDLSLYARAASPATLTASIVSAGGWTLASQNFSVPAGGWTKLAVALTPNQTQANCRLEIASATAATFWLDMVSLFPRDTWKGRTNGLRADLMAKIEAMQPAFVRFPGGCFVEGRGVETRVQWKKTIGPVEQRPGHYNIIWGYYSTDGLGYLEYLQMCEDLGAEALFVINCGMGHATNSSGQYAVPMAEMGPFVQDALDAIEYANGSTNTTWGARRAADGHPAPFNLKYMEIGNENWGTDYSDRYALFHDAIRTNYPAIRLIANERTASRTNDIVDPHFYSNPTAFLNAIDDWDNYSRSAPKIYVGEYAITEGSGTGNLRAALCEGAYLTGLERNSDMVLMASYAPLFCRTGWRGWNPNAILFDQSRTYGTPSYWLQTMYAASRGDRILPVTMTIAAPTVPDIAGKIGVGTWGGSAKFKDIVVTNAGGVLYRANFTNGMADWKVASGTWSVDTNNNAILQSDATVNGSLAKAGDLAWNNYTLMLRAMKVSGNEGFLITFGSVYDGEKSWWNLGGWGNTAHGIESPGISTPNVAGSIQTNQWYDIRIELQGATAKFYLNGQLIHSVTRTAQNSFTALGGRKNAGGETILKFVNTSAEAREVDVRLQGGGTGTSFGRAWVMTSTNDLDENSYSDPRHIVPTEDIFVVSWTNFTRLFPANSVTVLRVGTNAGPPVVVTGLEAAGNATNVALTWDDSSGATTYNVKRSAQRGGPYETIAAGVTATHYSDAGLNPASTYYYVVSAVRATGESANCEPVPGVLHSVLPDMPSPFADALFNVNFAGRAGAYSLVTNGTVIRAPGLTSGADLWNNLISPADGNEYEWNPASAIVVTNANGVGTISLKWSGTSFRDWNAGNWSYDPMFKGYFGYGSFNSTMDVCALDTNGTYDLYVYFTWGHNSWPMTYAITQGTATITSKVITPGTSTATSPGGNYANIVEGANYVIFADIAPSATGVISVKCTGTDGGWSGLQIVKRPEVAGRVPFIPEGLGAAAVSTSQINLSWSASVGATNYTVKRATGSGGPFTVIATGVEATSYGDSGLSAGTTYYYVVSAVNSTGESANSAQAGATTHSGSDGPLIHRYNFGETNGTSVADSVGGPVWNGVLPNGGTLTNGWLALSSTSSQYANLPAGILSSLSNFTLMAWVNLDSADTWSRIFDFGNSTASYLFLTPQIGGTIRFAVTTNGNGAEQQINCSSGLGTGAWHQVAVTLNGSVGTLYLDGAAVGTNRTMTLRPSSLGGTTNNFLGKSQWPDPYMNGRMDEFRIYSTALSSAEIAATMALGPGRLLTTNSPQVGMCPAGTNMTFSWPLSSAGFALQSRTNLAAGGWQNVSSSTPQISGGQWRMTLPVAATNPGVFYRLVK
jgi:alpha-L-arabinofuranosidase